MCEVQVGGQVVYSLSEICSKPNFWPWGALGKKPCSEYHPEVWLFFFVTPWPWKVLTIDTFRAIIIHICRSSRKKDSHAVSQLSECLVRRLYLPLLSSRIWTIGTLVLPKVNGCRNMAYSEFKRPGRVPSIGNRIPPKNKAQRKCSRSRWCRWWLCKWRVQNAHTGRHFNARF